MSETEIDQKWVAEQAAKFGVEPVSPVEQVAIIEEGDRRLGLKTVVRGRGRPRRLSPDEAIGMVRELAKGLTTGVDMAHQLGLSYPTLLRYYGAYRDQVPEAKDLSLRQIRIRGAQRNLFGDTRPASG